MTTHGLPQASEKQNIPPQSTFANNENAGRIFTNFLPHMKLGGPALPQRPKSSFNNEKAFDQVFRPIFQMSDGGGNVKIPSFMKT